MVVHTSWLDAQLPPFSEIDLDQAKSHLQQLIANNRNQLSRLIQSQPGWQQLVKPWEDLEDQLERFWSPIRHLHAVQDGSQVRDVYEHGAQSLTMYSTEVAQNSQLYQALKAIYNNQHGEPLDETQRQVLAHHIRDFELAGVHLPAAQKQRFATLEEHLTQLHTQFEQNVLDATQYWYEHLIDDSWLQGLPDYTIQSAKESASARHLTGWVLTLDEPCLVAVLMYSQHEPLRQRVYEAHLTRASDKGPHIDQWDNSRVMARILHCQDELAKLLGYQHFADYALVTKMAQSASQVQSFLEQMADRALPHARDEWQVLQEFAQSVDGKDTLQPWDVAYYSEKRRQALFHFSQQDLRPYFQLSQVLSGLFELVNYLFGIEVRRVPDADVWQNDVRLYAVYDEQHKRRGYFYLDLYARHNKRGGAWMDECRIRRRNTAGDLQYPVAFLTCNFQSPVADEPSLLTHEEVITLFHEFGHTLHHVLTQVDHTAVSGINGVPWDVVEFPSQFMEHWAWQKPVLRSLSCHYRTGEAIDEDLLDRLVQSRQFHSAMRLTRQLEFALFDWHLHQQNYAHDQKQDTVRRIQTTLNQVRQQVRVTPVADFDRFQHSFSHIFSGAYAAGYYSYMWAEVLASDAFARFEEEGVWSQTAGRDFLRCILEQGGSRPPEMLFRQFRGRDYSLEPLLQHYGL